MYDREGLTTAGLAALGLLALVACSQPAPEAPSATAEPVLYVVSMMHAEEAIPFHENQRIYQSFATSLEAQRALFDRHGARIDFGPDWTFIEGVKAWDPDQLTDHIAAGHGLHTHAHERKRDLADVSDLLASAGVAGNRIANGGFLAEGPGGTNWAGYVSSIEDAGGAPRFTTAIAYKNAQTQVPDTSGTCFRPSLSGEWTVHDPAGPLLYLGSNSNGVAGEGALDFDTLRSWMDDRLENLDPEATNTLYWHDSLHKYAREQEAADRRARWEQEFEEYLDPLTEAGRIQWRTFEEMTAICLAAQ